MPELPEVETVKLDLEQIVKGHTFQKVVIFNSKNLKGITPDKFKRILKGKTIKKVQRFGKGLFLSLSSGYAMLIHLKMTGQFYRPFSRETITPHTHFLFFLDNNILLAFRDVRKFGVIYLDKEEIVRDIPYLKSLGLDPISKQYTWKTFQQVLKCQSKRVLKPFLLDQHHIAGIGNIYASEILFAAGISPLKTVRELTGKQQKELFKHIPRILKKAITYRGTTVSDFRDITEKSGAFQKLLKVYGRRDQSCLVCRSPILRIVQNGRSTFFCRNCQR